MHLLDRFFPAILIVLLLGLALAIVYGVLQRTEVDIDSRGSIYRQQGDGASRLRTRLTDLGYEIRALTKSPLSLSAQDSVLFVLAPNASFKAADLIRIDAWVRAGGMLIVAQETRNPGQLLAHYRIALAPLIQPVERASLRLPALNWPPVGEIQLRAANKLRLQRQDAAIHIGDCDTPLLVSFGLEQGQLFVLPTLYPLSNDGLAVPDNARLVENLLRAGATRSGRIVFDELHHRKPDRTISVAWLFTRPEGWGFLYAIAVLFGYLLLSGRRFGSPRSVPDQDAGLPAAALSQTAASLESLTGVQSVVQCYYWEHLKTDLSRTYHLDPTLSDDAFLSTLRRHHARSEVNLAALTHLHAGLGREAASEQDLVIWVRQVIEWRENLNARLHAETK